MTDFSEEEMPGWKTPAMEQRQDREGFISKKKIAKNLEHLREVLRPEDSLLDVGCYKGHLRPFLGHENYFGIDIFPEHIEEARRLHPDGKFECSDFRELKGKWDVVWCCRVLIHMPDFATNVEILKRLARRKLILVIPVGHKDTIDHEPTVYFRTFARESVETTGPTEILMDTGRYATVIYDR